MAFVAEALAGTAERLVVPSSLTTHPTKIWGRDRGGTELWRFCEVLLRARGMSGGFVAFVAEALAGTAERLVVPSSLSTHPTKIWGRDRGGTEQLWRFCEVIIHSEVTYNMDMVMDGSQQI